MTFDRKPNQTPIKSIGNISLDSFLKIAPISDDFTTEGIEHQVNHKRDWPDDEDDSDYNEMIEQYIIESYDEEQGDIRIIEDKYEPTKYYRDARESLINVLTTINFEITSCLLKQLEISADVKGTSINDAFNDAARRYISGE